MTRADRAAEVARLRREGLAFAQIGERLGISRAYAHALYHDPDGSADRVRKARYGGTCVDCGARTNGSHGAAAAPKRCSPCSHVRQHAERFWTRERIVERIREWAQRFGAPPAAPDWEPALAWLKLAPEEAERRVARFERSGGRSRWPNVLTVQNECGSWAAAIEAAGFPRPTVGEYERTPQVRERYSRGQRRSHERRRSPGYYRPPAPDVMAMFSGDA